MLFIGFTTITYWLGPQLDEAVIEFAMGPVVLWIRGVAESERRKAHVLQTGCAQASASDGPPELLAVWRQVALAGGGDCDQNNMMLH